MFGLTGPDQLQALLKAMGVKVTSTELTQATKRGAVLAFVESASASDNVIQLTGELRGGGKLSALVIVSK